MLNTNLKLISKALAKPLKDNILPGLILSNQTMYAKNRYISESGRIIYDVLETASIDIKKAFDSVDHYFSLAVLQKYSFGEGFLKWI